MAMNEKDMWLAVMLSAQPWLVLAGTFLAGYLFGSIPFGYLYGRLAGVGDIRKIGSGNIGATNVLRTGRKGLALATLLSDAAKGFVPVLLCRQYLGMEPALFAAAGAFLGHLYPVWLRFRGGKGRRDVYRRYHGSLLACGCIFLRGLARHCGCNALFVALGAHRGGPHSHFGGPPRARRALRLYARHLRFSYR